MKKKIVFLLTISMLVTGSIASGCARQEMHPEQATESQSGEENISEYLGDISKTQKIVVIPGEAEDAASQDAKKETEITDENEVREFTDKITEQVSEWKPGSLPENAVPAGTFVFYSQETLKLGQKPEDRRYVEQAALTVYEGSPYVTIKIDSKADFVSDLSLNMELPQETADYLAGFFVG